MKRERRPSFFVARGFPALSGVVKCPLQSTFGRENRKEQGDALQQTKAAAEKPNAVGGEAVEEGHRDSGKRSHD